MRRAASRENTKETKQLLGYKLMKADTNSLLGVS